MFVFYAYCLTKIGDYSIAAKLFNKFLHFMGQFAKKSIKQSGKIQNYAKKKEEKRKVCTTSQFVQKK